MECPKCDNTPLKRHFVKSKQVELDRCTRCKGLWFDATELNTILGERADPNLVVPSYALSQQNVQCPRCCKGMVEFCYPGTDTRVDICKSCQGIWLDDSEWNDINAARDMQTHIKCPECTVFQKKYDFCVSCGVVYDDLKP